MCWQRYRWRGIAGGRTLIEIEALVDGGSGSLSARELREPRAPMICGSVGPQSPFASLTITRGATAIAEPS